MRKQTLIPALSLLIAFGAVIAGAQGRVQYAGEEDYSTISLWVTAAAGKDHIRFASLGIGQRIRLEILNQAGDRVFDSDFREGNLLDWETNDNQGNRLPDDVYGCLVTVEDMTGRVSHRRSVFRVTDGAAQFDTSQTRNLEVADSPGEQETMTILADDEDLPMIQLLHDGEAGRIVSGKGGLSFRIGNALAGKDVEYVHLTADGNVGIGVSEPQAKLDVDGLIRASEGIQFLDGTILRMEDGFPVLVTDRPDASGGKPAGSASKSGGKTVRSLTMGGISRPLLLNEAPGRVAALEGDAPYYNTLYGLTAGGALTTGSNNSFFGYGAGAKNTEGNINTFFGWEAGYSNTTGGSNSFFGAQAGISNTSGELNSFFGEGSGNSNTTGENNSFFGAATGGWNTTGFSNSFIGAFAGLNNTSGYYNSFVGYEAGQNNTTGGNNSFVGYGAGNWNNIGTDNSFFGSLGGYYNTTGILNSFFGTGAGYFNEAGYYNSFVGSWAGHSNTVGNYNTSIGAYADGTSDITNATAVGSRAKVTQSNSLVLGSINGVNTATADTNVGIGTTAPGARLDIIGVWGAPGSSIPTGWANRVTGRHGVVNGNSGLYEDVFGTYAELSTYKWDERTTLPLVLNANGGNVGIGTAAPGAKLDVIGSYGLPGSSIPTDWANRVTGRRGVVNGNRGFYEDIFQSPYGYYAELSTYKWDDNTTLPLVFNANGGNVGIGTVNPKAKLQTDGGDIYVGGPGQGIILKSPDGLMCVKLTVNNAGQLLTTPLACP